MNEELTKVVALDSIFPFLKFSERLLCQRLRNRKGIDTPLPFRVQKAVQLIQQFKWEIPEQHIKEDRIVRFYDVERERWKNINNYKHEILKQVEQLNK